MQIKDVEKITGLTKKSIRYYETKGLLQVHRGKENDYRDYTEEDVELLKKIKIYRFLEFSIEDIRALLQMEPEALSEELQKKADSFETAAIENQLKQNLCIDLKKKRNYEDLYDTVDDLDEEKMETLKTSLLEFTYTNTYAMIFGSLILLGPVFSLFLNIHEQQYSAMGIKLCFALVCTVLLVLDWSAYFRFRKNHSSQLKIENQNNRMLLPVLLLAIAITIGGGIGIGVLQEKLLTSTDYLFFEPVQVTEILLIADLVLCSLLLVTMFLNAFHIKSKGGLDELYKFISQHKRIRAGLIAAVIFIAYCGFSSINVVTENSIIIYRPWNITGTACSYEDVSSVSAAFTKKGDFRYTVDLDGKHITFSAPSVNPDVERYQSDSYLELEEFDQKLMETGVSKESDSKYSDRATLDQVYIDRFLRIIENR